MIDLGIGEFSKWLAATEVSHVIQTTTWIIPTLQTIHILSVAAVFSAAILVDLRIWRLIERDEPRRSLLNSTFYLKMALLVVAILLTIGLQRSISSSPNSWDRDRWRRIVGRFAATVSILVWCGILFAGRWIAYTQAG